MNAGHPEKTAISSAPVRQPEPMSIHIPELGPQEGSWVVSRIATGEVIGEFFYVSAIERFNGRVCKCETIGTYLARINAAKK